MQGRCHSIQEDRGGGGGWRGWVCAYLGSLAWLGGQSDLQMDVKPAAKRLAAAQPLQPLAGVGHQRRHLHAALALH